MTKNKTINPLARINGFEEIFCRKNLNVAQMGFSLKKKLSINTIFLIIATVGIKDGS
jgi:hypothetical protein